MYYYIFQSPKKYSENKTHERIKNILTVLGISGETTLVSPARSASELALMGVEKGYSTIVAIGSDEVINEVASSICGSGAVLGIIPIEASEDINQLVGTNNIKDACEALQKRRLKTINMGYIEPDINFLTKITLVSSKNKPLSIQAEINDYYFETSADKVIIDHNLGVHMYTYNEKKFLDNLLSFFGNKNEIKDYSYFNAERLSLRTHEIIPIKIGDLKVAKTPIVAYRRPKALKIIKFYSKIK